MKIINIYIVEIREELSKKISIEAHTEEEALTLAHKMYSNEEIVLEYEDFKGHSIDIIDINF